MKHVLSTLFLLLTAVMSVADDKLISYDQATSIITVDRGGQLKTYRVKPITELTINGVKAPIGSLTPGMMVTVTLSDPQTASRIAARGITPAQFNGRLIVLKIRVDGTDIVRVRDGKLTIEHVTAKKPESININGVDWSPKWNDKETEPFADFTPPLIPFGAPQVRFKQVTGRGKVQMDKMPQGNFEKILTLRVEDGGGGADDYEIHLSW
jgi:hypothetical protein